MEDSTEDDSHFDFSERTVYEIEVLQLEPMEGTEVTGYEDDAWFRSTRTGYEQFKADLLDALHPDILDPGGAVWEPYEFDGGGEMIDVNVFAFYYHVIVFKDSDGIRVNVQEYS